VVTMGTSPVRFIVWDDLIPTRPDWPLPDEWEVEYTSDVERGKKTTRDLPPWAETVLKMMLDFDVLRACSQVFGLIWPDLSLWGGGLQVMGPGSSLAPHLDGVLHPQFPQTRRAVQMVAFCHHYWKPEWGGEFAFFDPDGRVAAKFQPAPGRLVAFDSSHDLAYHGVLPVSGGERVTVATSLLADARPTDTRRRALFMPPRGRAT
jgi:hypothetical protein